MSPEYKKYGRLTRGEIAALRAGPEWTAGLADFVRFGELDGFNHVNNAAYLRWFETMRVAMLNDLGLMPGGKYNLTPVIRHLSVDYLRPVLMEEDYHLLAKIARVGRTSLTFEMVVLVADERRLTTSNTLVMLNPKTGQPTEIPQECRDKMAMG